MPPFYAGRKVEAFTGKPPVFDRQRVEAFIGPPQKFPMSFSEIEETAEGRRFLVAWCGARLPLCEVALIPLETIATYHHHHHQ